MIEKLNKRDRVKILTGPQMGASATVLMDNEELTDVKYYVRFESGPREGDGKWFDPQALEKV